MEKLVQLIVINLPEELVSFSFEHLEPQQNFVFIWLLLALGVALVVTLSILWIRVAVLFVPIRGVPLLGASPGSLAHLITAVVSI